MNHRLGDAYTPAGTHRGVPGAPPHDPVEQEPVRARRGVGSEAELAIHDRGEPVGTREGGQLSQSEQRAAVVVEAFAHAIGVHGAELRAQREEQVDVRRADARGELVEGALRHVRAP